MIPEISGVPTGADLERRAKDQEDLNRKDDLQYCPLGRPAPTASATNGPDQRNTTGW
jgi:hypothetical protein